MRSRTRVGPALSSRRHRRPRGGNDGRVGVHMAQLSLANAFGFAWLRARANVRISERDTHDNYFAQCGHIFILSLIELVRRSVAHSCASTV